MYNACNSRSSDILFTLNRGRDSLRGKGGRDWQEFLPFFLKMIIDEDTLDREHREIYAVLAALKEYPNLDVFMYCSDLIDHLTLHFHNEEHWMLAHKYPLWDEHSKKHRAIQDHFLNHLRLMLRKDEGAKVLVDHFIDELTHHLEHDDRAIEEFANEL